MTIERYTVKAGPDKGKEAFKGMVVCPTCEEKYEINTISEKIANNPSDCFMCYMAKRNVK